MKKIVAAVSAAFIAFGAYAGVQAAALPTMSPEAVSYVTVTSKDGLYSASVENLTEDAEAASLRSVIYAADSLAIGGASAGQTFEVTARAGKDMPTDVYLRLTTENVSTDAEYAASKLLNTYIMTIKDSDNTTLYNSAVSSSEVKKTGANDYSADIFLGRFNDDDSRESKTYTIDLKLPKNLAAADIKNLKKVKWQIVSDPAEANATMPPIPEVTVTASPETAVSASTSEAPGAVSTSTPEPAATAVPSASPAATDDPSMSVSSGSAKVVGTEKGQIQPGKYTLTASNKEAVVKIYGSDGKLKSEYELSEKVPSVVIELVEGDKLENNGAIDLKEYRAATTAPRTTTKPAATTAPARTAAATPKATAVPAKTNPKTGDTAPIAGVSVLAIFALGMMAYPGIEKKRNKKD